MIWWADLAIQRAALVARMSPAEAWVVAVGAKEHLQTGSYRCSAPQERAVVCPENGPCRGMSHSLSMPCRGTARSRRVPDGGIVRSR